MSSQTPGGAIEISPADGIIFANTRTDDLVFRTTNSNQRMLFGTMTSCNATMLMTSNAVTVVGRLATSNQILSAALPQDSSANPAYSFADDAATGMFHPSLSNIAFATTGREVVRIDADGRLGIGVSNPTNRLHVAGGSYIGGNMSVASNINVSGDVTVSGVIGGTVLFPNPLSIKGIVVKKGDFAISTSNSTFSAVQGLSNTPSGVIFSIPGNTSSNTFQFQANNTSQMTLTGDGRLGIRTIPTEVLDVNGNIKSTGNIQASISDTNTAPAYTWSNDTTTGFYHVGQGTVGFTSFGSNVVTMCNTTVSLSNASLQINGVVVNPNANTVTIDESDPLIINPNKLMSVLRNTNTGGSNTNIIMASWGVVIDGTGADVGNKIAIDASSNIYVAGTYGPAAPTMYLPNGSVSTYPTLRPTSGGTSAFVAKLDFSGFPLWVASVDGTGSDQGVAVAIDNSQNVYLTGSYGPGVATIYNTSNVASAVTMITPSNTTAAAFCVRFNSNGIAQWVVTVDGTSTDNGTSIAVDSQQNVYMGGNCINPPTIYNSNNIASSVTISPNAGSWNYFLVKYDSNGTAQWGGFSGGIGSKWAYINSITVDPIRQHNVYITVQYGHSWPQWASQVYLYSANNTYYTTAPFATNRTAGLVVNYNSNGSIQGFVNMIQGTGTDGAEGTNALVYDVAVDSNGSYYTCGYTDTGFYTNNSVTFNRAGAFAVKYNSAGTAQWVVGLSGDGWEVARSVRVTNAGDIYIAGWATSNTIIYNSNSQISPLTYRSLTSNTAYVIRYDSLARAQFATSIDPASIASLALDPAGNIHVCGNYVGAPTIYNSDLSTTLALRQSQSNAMFLTKFGAIGIYTLSNLPTESNGLQKILYNAASFSNPVYVRLCDTTGSRNSNLALYTGQKAAFIWYNSNWIPSTYELYGDIQVSTMLLTKSIYGNINDTASQPSFTWANDSNTGLYHLTDGQIGVSCFSSNVMAITRSGVGINASTPSTMLDVGGSIKTSSNFIATTSDNRFSPAFTWSNDTSTGMFRGSASNIGFTINTNAWMNITPSNVLHSTATTTVNQLNATAITIAGTNTNVLYFPLAASNSLYATLGASSNSTNFSSNTSVWASNTSFFSSNVAVFSSNTAITACNIALFSSNTSITACNISNFSSNTAITACNIALFSSNTSITACNISNFSSNTAITACNISIFSSNTGITSCNIAIASSNAAFWTSNNALKLTGGTLSGSLTVNGDLFIQGSTTTVNTSTLTIQDNILLINRNQTGTPPSSLWSGIEVERGDASNYYFIFEEATQLFKVGLSNSLQAVTTRNDVMASGYAYYDNNTSMLTNRAITISDVTSLTSELAFSSNLGWFSSNSAISACNIALAASNTAVTGCNIAIAASNTATSAYTIAVSASNTANSAQFTATNALVTGGTANTLAVYSSNVAISASNIAVAASNRAFICGIASWSNNERNVFIFNSNIGIGTSNPSQPLEISSSSNAHIQMTNTTFNVGFSNALMFAHYGGTACNIARMYSFLPGHNMVDLRFETASNGTRVETLNLTNGMVGIGLSNPTVRLDVNGSIETNSKFLANVSDSSNAPAYTWTGDTNTGLYRFATGRIGISCGGVQTMTLCNNAINVTGDINLSGNIYKNGSLFVSGGGGGGWSNVGSNIFVMGSNVGIGTSNPLSALDVRGQLTLGNDSGWTTGGIRFRNTSNSQDAGVAQSTNGQLVFRAPLTDGSNGFTWTNGGATQNLMTLDNTGNLNVFGDVVAVNTSISDSNFKENVQPYTTWRDTLDKLNPVTFTWRANAPVTDAKKNTDDIGLIAQEVGEVFPLAHGHMVTNQGYCEIVRYEKFIALLIAAVKDAHSQIDALKSLLTPHI
jgi:hypothetical protein